MILTCQECSTRFNLDESLLKETGSKVRCSVCQHIYTAYPERKTPEPPSVPAQEEPSLPAEGETAEEELFAGFGEDVDEADEIAEEPADMSPEELEDVTQMFESEEAPADEAASADAQMLDPDVTVEPEKAGEVEEELDFSDLEAEFESGAESGPEDEVEEPDLDLSDLEAELELESEAEEDEAGEELDLDFEAAEAEDEAEEELDLSDLEAELELESEAEEDEAGEELDLDFEAAEAEDEAEEGLDLSDLEAEEKLDLSDLDAELGLAAEEEPETLEIEDILEEEKPPETEDEEAAEESPAAAEEDELDLSEIEQMIETAELEPEEIEAAEKDADTEAEDAAAEKPFKPGAVYASAEADLEESESDVEETEEEDFLEDEEPETAKKKRLGAPVMILLILILLGAGGYGAYVATNTFGIKIPFLSAVSNLGTQIPIVRDFIQPPIQDPGNLRIGTADISGKFINNAQAGKLFIITGNARNDYPEARSLIKITGKLYSKGKKLQKTETVYGGNTLSDAELANMDLEAIKLRVNNRAGDNKLNFNIGPGRVVPFTIVFSDLPDNLEEYTLEVVESYPAVKQ